MIIACYLKSNFPNNSSSSDIVQVLVPVEDLNMEMSGGEKKGNLFSVLSSPVFGDFILDYTFVERIVSYIVLLSDIKHEGIAEQNVFSTSKTGMTWIRTFY